MLILSLQHITKAKDTRLNIKVRGRDQKLDAEARGYEAEAKILASRPVWPRGFNISGINE